MMKWLFAGLAGILALILGLLAYVYLILVPDLPPITAVTDYKPKIPLRIYTADNTLIGEFGEEHRDFVPIKDIPDTMKKAILAVEDARFYEHHGVDYIGMARAVVSTATGAPQGGGTITMQVARNFFLTRERTVSRKLREILLARRIEDALSKDQILELYMNQIYLGQRTHGFSSAARIYFNKSMKELSIAEAAMLAGIPKNPARHNPAVNFDRAKERQLVVLKSMERHKYITESQYEVASKERLHVTKVPSFESHAAYVAEMVRQSIYAQFKEDTYTAGIKVITTIDRDEQEAAYESLRRNVLTYDQRHGYRGPEAFIDLPSDASQRDDAIDEFLQKFPASEGLISGVVTEVTSKLIKADLATGESIQITGEGLRLANAALQSKANRDLKIRPGALIRVMQDAKGNWSVTQSPEVDAAYVSLNAQTGAYRAMVGGFDFNRKKFNHVTSAWRQPGSSIKPFIYSAALEKGFYPSTLINDVQLSSTTEEDLKWDPRNDDGKYDGPIEMQRALAVSKNVVSVRILKNIGAGYGRDYLPRFGFDQNKHPINLTLALGTGSVTPLQLAGAYAVFANGGYQVKPWLIDKVIDAKGTVLFQANVAATPPEDQRVIDARNAFVTDSMLREVVRSGTGASATQKLARRDLAGKTGTTSDAVDGWFAGYAGNIVAVSWMGYDEPKSLGGREFGATVALPIWIDAMRHALAGKPEFIRAVPQNVINVDGKWMYIEYQNGGGVTTLDMTEPPPPPTDPQT
ncbi:PBP1A family penicillin-binding protein [Undibacterium sp. LX40W]|uniref:Penicillin-binding protein 1A n=1 Tax=Undibacterium nitidum TaxID=2762298 RepID=A0A923HKF3_9BURK|nr:MULTISPECIES: PBP1A family penicillin-binding protein [Undibacterium]MBC3881029.1 PBP1A family penicillin-binding protein [Undibacterium nitidum]MBC3890238.1 PBP1A family penicillin-binding protein [Undibacterium sp. LX40W]